MQIRHRPETQTLFAQLYELVAAHELDLVGGFATGLAIEREVRGRLYLYWQLRDLAGRLRQIYLGPAADPTARELRDALAAYKVRRAPIVADLERLTAAYVASGGPRHLGHHFRVVDALARAGLFRAGVLLVGSHAFVSIGAALGVSWSAEDAATADIDLCRDEFVTVACVSSEHHAGGGGGRRPALRDGARRIPRRACADVTVGRHHPPSGSDVARFMDYFARRFELGRMGSSQKIVAMAVAHHRFNYIHPFPDGNGRVSRLMSHAMALKAGIGAHGLWSISRGLARGIKDRSEYKLMMDAADSPRTSDTDGRGNLSASALLQFVTWFIEVARDQVTFMASLFQFDRLRDRLQEYAAGPLQLGDDARALVDEIFLRGEVARGEAPRITKRPERTAREVLAKLIRAGLVGSETPKGDVSVRFSSDSAHFLFPLLFPAQADAG